MNTKNWYKLTACKNCGMVKSIIYEIPEVILINLDIEECPVCGHKGFIPMGWGGNGVLFGEI